MSRIVKVCELAGIPAKKALLSWLNDAEYLKGLRNGRISAATAIIEPA